MSTLTPEQARSDLAAAAGIEAHLLDASTDVVGLGIDSVRLMGLVDRWQAEGVEIRFPDLAACSTVGEVVDLVSAAPRGGAPQP